MDAFVCAVGVDEDTVYSKSTALQVSCTWQEKVLCTDPVPVSRPGY